MTYPARTERAALADLLTALGPDAPTLCEGWATRDLAAHLVVRERRPDAAGGIWFSPVAAHTERVQAGFARRPYADLVRLVRTGPPHWSLTRLEPADRLVNSVEFFVHHEDVRRAQRAWEPREVGLALERELWRILRSRARAFYRRADVGVVLRPPGRPDVLARDGEPGVVVVGPVSELMLHAMGRTGHARVLVEGEPEVVRRFEATPLGV